MNIGVLNDDSENDLDSNNPTYEKAESIMLMKLIGKNKGKESG